LAESLNIRHLIDPDAVPTDIFGHALLAFVQGALKAETPDIATEWRDFLGRHGIRDLEPTYDESLPRPSNQIIDATLRLLATNDYDAFTVEDIAAQADVAIEVVYGAWGSRVRLATAVLARLAEPTGEQYRFDADLGINGVRALDRQLGRLAALYCDVARSRPALLLAAMQGALEYLDRPPEDEGNLGRALFGPLDAGQQDGSIADSIDSRELARTLGNALASSALRHKGGDPAGPLAFARTLLQGGVVRRTR
jgi:AcrR family transcriptional regulator